MQCTLPNASAGKAEGAGQHAHYLRSPSLVRVPAASVFCCFPPDVCLSRHMRATGIFRMPRQLLFLLLRWCSTIRLEVLLPRQSVHHSFFRLWQGKHSIQACCLRQLGLEAVAEKLRFCCCEFQSLLCLQGLTGLRLLVNFYAIQLLLRSNGLPSLHDFVAFVQLIVKDMHTCGL